MGESQSKPERDGTERVARRKQPSLYKESLRSDAIRLLTIKPGSAADPIECSLAVHHTKRLGLAKWPVYEALSYVWGSAAPEGREDGVTIVCNEQRVPIRPNLLAALRVLRAKLRARVVWIDAICMNQADLEEKNHQVQLMRLIYQNARATIIFLGGVDEDTAAGAVELCRRVSRVFQRYMGTDDHPFNTIDELRNREKPSSRAEWNALLEAENLPGASTPAWQQLVSVLNNPYFFRSWVVQEAIQSRSATVQIGVSSCGFLELGYAMAWTHGIGGMAYLSPMEGPTRALRLYLGYVIHSTPLSKLLIEHQGLQATDPRDHIYAFLGISAEYNTAKKAIPQALRPRYDAPVAEVYTEVMRHLLLHPFFDFPVLNGEGRIIPDLELLDLLCHDSDESLHDECFPSWVPRWDLGHQRGWTNGQVLPAYPAVKAETKALSSRTMAFRGLALDTVRWVTRSLVDQDGRLLQPKHHLQTVFTEEWIKTVDMCKQGNAEISLEKMADTFNLTLTGRPLSEQELAGYLCRAELVRCYRASADRRGKAETYKLEDSQSPASSVAQVDNYPLPGPLLPLDYVEYMTSASEDLGPWFVTGKGLIGRGPWIVREGDRLCILFGARMAAVLRPLKQPVGEDAGSEHFKFVGWAPSGSLANGEAMEMWRNGQAHDQWFKID